MEQLKLLYTKKEAAAALGVCVRTLEHLIAKGDLLTKRIGKKVLIPHRVLVKYASEDHPEPVAG